MTDICYNLHASQNQAEQKKPNSKDFILYESLKKTELTYHSDRRQINGFLGTELLVGCLSRGRRELSGDRNIIPNITPNIFIVMVLIAMY